MKYGILENIVDLSSCTLANITICKNLYPTLREKDRSHFRLVQIEEEVPEGVFLVKLMEGKLQLPDKSFFGYKIIDLSKHLIQFEPDGTFEVFGTGVTKEVTNPLKKASYEGSKKCFLFFSEKEGPSAWMKAVTDYNTLDFGEVIDVKPLL